MDPKYSAWIAAFVQKCNGNVEFRCQTAAEQMCAAFPELRIVRGWVIAEHVRQIGRVDCHQHWWCCLGNEIIDPTAAQYITICEYDEYSLEKHGPLPTGKCYDCGALLYDNKTFCNDDCENNTLDYLSEIRCHVTF